MKRLLTWALASWLVIGLLAPLPVLSQSQTQKTSSVDGAHVTTGARADASSTDHTSTNSLMSFLKGLVRMFSDVWDDGNNRINVAIQNTPTVTANAGTGTFPNQQSNISVDADTGAGTQTLTLFGIALPASGGAVIGGTATNPFIVGDGSGPLTVDGTVAATQSGAWNITNISGTVSLPTGAATSAKQPALGTAGSASADVLTVQGIASMTPLFVGSNIAHDAAAAAINPLLIGGYASAAAPANVSADGDAVRAWFLRNGAAAIAVTAGGALIGGDTSNGLDVDVTRVPTDPFGANADAASATGSLSAKLRFIASTGIPITNFPTAASTSAIAIRCVNTAGNAYADCGGAGGSGTQYTEGDTDSTITGNAMLFESNTGTHTLSAVNATTPLPVHVQSTSVGSTSEADDGSLATGVTGMTEVIAKSYAMDSQAAAWTRWTHQLLDYDSGGGTENLSVIGLALPGSGGPVAGGTSANPINVAFPSAQAVTQSGTFTVQPGNTANSTPWLVSTIPATTGGTVPCYITSAVSTNATNCKASAGQLYGVEAVNTTGTLYYLRLYNLAAAPTCSSATGFVRTIPVPPYAVAGGAGGLVVTKFAGETYGTGLGFCLTGGGSSTDNSNAATGVYVTLNYK